MSVKVLLLLPAYLPKQLVAGSMDSRSERVVLRGRGFGAL
jgi:hypothetical protein